MRPHGVLFACAAVVLCVGASVGNAAQIQMQPRYWYDGTIKMPLYRQPRLDVQTNSSARARGGAHIAPRVYERSPPNPAEAPPALAVYSTKPQWRGARLMIQAPGVLFTVTDDASGKRAQAWLAARGWRAEPIADGAAFKIGAIAGEQALDLANALYESGLVQYAQPNWVMDIDR